MGIQKIRYAFEHDLLPKFFHEETGNFIVSVLKDKGILFRIINDMFEKAGIENPYSAEQFDADGIKITDTLMMIKLEFPEPESEPLCYRCYLFFDDKFERLGFYSIEKGHDLPFVCSWSKDKTHSNYGTCTFKENNDVLRCVEIHMNKYYRDTKQ